MGLSKYKFGELLELTNEKNSDGKYGENDAIGVNVDKIILPMRGKISEKDFSKFHLVPPGHFAYNPRGSRKLGIGFNDTDRTFIITFNDNVFRIKPSAKNILLDTYLFMYLSRKEWDRYAEFISWGSSTEVFDWTYFCDEEISLPPIDIQQKYVAVYNAMLANQQSYERGLEDLKLTCDAYIEKLRRENECFPIGNYVHPYNEKNINGEITLEQGINIEKCFITPQRSNDNFYGRKIVRTGQIAYCTQLNNENVAVALRTGPDCIVSNVYDVIEFNDGAGLMPKYLMLWLIRKEFGRFVYWASQGTSYEFLTYESLSNYGIPVPSMEIQQDIVNIYEAYLTRKEINEKLKTQIKDLCPILIKGSIEEAQG